MKRRSGFQVMMRLIGLVKPLTGYMLLAIFMGLIGHLCAAFITIFGGYAVLNVLGTGDYAAGLTGIFISVCIFALLRGILRYAEQACNHYIAFKLLALIRDKVFRALRRLCPAKLEGRDKGNLISVITSDIELLEVFYAHTVSPVAIAVLFSGVLCLFVGAYHWSLGVLALAAYLTVGAIIPVVISCISGEDGMKFRSKSGELGGFVLDSLRGLSETIQYGNGAKRLAEMNAKTEALAVDEARMKKVTGRNMAVTNTVILVFDLAMLFLCTALYQNGILDFDGVLIPTIALMSSFGPCVALANLGSTLQNTFAAGNRVLDILEETPAVSDITGKEEITFEGANVNRVTFAYGGEAGTADSNMWSAENGMEDALGRRRKTQTQERPQPAQNVVLSEVSVEIPKNTVVGIVGRSGSGKSTLLKLLMRFWKVQQGSVAISGTALEEISTANLRAMESFVTQQTHLFHDSIRNNLRIARLDATEEEIVAACKKASVHDFIMSLPQGYDTPVGELGDTLSGGERQRIGLARAFLHDAPFMLLDEPTSNLDSLNEAVILKSLHEARADKTVVLVSHRKSTMGIADKVYSVEHGRMGRL
ncbi:MAG: ABC transporter ATP-binding protein [Lachnospiraceae bacterium]|nr:ABC transporter ATP-binding protein [Lachnospiraceae bacterium]